MPIHIQEVIPRDGFQMEKKFIPTEDKINIINKISRTGVSKIEVTSFVSPKAVPQLSDAEEVAKNIERNKDVTYVGLVANLRGAERAMNADLDEINLVMSASASHNKKNVNKTHEESLEGFSKIAAHIKGSGIKINGTVATAFGCPFEGAISEKAVMGFIRKYIDLGMDSITLADTTGMANPSQIKRFAAEVKDYAGEIPLTLHLHDTRGMGLANLIAGMEAGVTRFDSAIGGIGGCPFAPGASGNICTEDVVHMFGEMGISHTADLDQLISISKELPDIIGRSDYPGQVVKAGKVSDLHEF
ncbi:hydroxymethylglutaryl-CoA lyase [Lacicoccus alkaliphilus]|uniref:Hydroxymethylglutaryl-CoA lyase n=1 Tax=Lacicoccus alkaliphilus DSM 16010 TaxID=1123231 RepID=A0A1M7AA82_9BACL|nr:hydroxymethylglutaryl-CoA lyase [Salinicoccus alkaliphilus]SHL39610.1 hydroxymethylglutaryl-CoA lyase [Salinicoccus alkaliphilus DSM 16010]